MRKFLLKSVLFIGILLLSVHINGQDISGPVTLAMSNTGAYSIVERSDWRRYDNGRYVGLVRHEVRASIIPKTTGHGNDTLLYQGNFFVLQNTLRDMRQSAQSVDAVVPVSFELHRNGTIVIEKDMGFPALRGFPTFPAQKVVPGFKWRAPASRAVDPFNTGDPAIITFNADYEYRGVEKYKDIWVYKIYAIYGYNYQSRNPGSNGFSRVQGSHKVDILIRVDDGLPIFMHDDLDEKYTMIDGSTVQFKGFSLTFGSGIIPMDRSDVIASLGNKLKIESLSAPNARAVVSEPPVPSASLQSGLSEAEDQKAAASGKSTNTAILQDSAIDLAPVPEGIRLTIKDIRFVPDSAEFLPAERSRLDLIADALKQIPDRVFLVEGHTAATGKPAGELELSIERAKRMVDELERRGIKADRFIYKGWGGTKPIGDNSTNAGRSANRRVEITILE
jgi:OmpA-OmpF porin, OOP family